MWTLTPANESSRFVTYGISGIALIMAALCVIAVWCAERRDAYLSAVIVTSVLSAEAALAGSGLLQRWDLRPPPFPLMFVPLTVGTARLAFSNTSHALVANLSLPVLVGAQAFRLPLELIMHQAVLDGVMPPQLSYDGLNFDVLTGFTAIPLALLVALNVAPRWLIWAWNILGFALLATVVGIALASMPTVQLFGPDKVSTWVTYTPFVWLPGFLVQSALFAHILLWRKLRAITSAPGKETTSGRAGADVANNR